MYSELLKLCGYEEEEIERERPRIDRAFEKLGIGAEDIARGEKRIKHFYDIELVGMRKVLGVWMKELINLVLAREEGKRIIYLSYPPVGELNATASLVSEDIYAINPEVVLNQTIGQIFDKLNPLLEAAEKDLLPPGLANCSLLQVRLGALLKGIIPMPDLFWSFGFYCDQSPKLDELMAERYGVPQIVMNYNKALRADGDFWKLIDLETQDHFGNELRRNFREFQEWAGFEISEDRVKKDFLPPYYNVYYADEEIRNLLRNADPLPMSIVSYQFISQAQRTCSRLIVGELPAVLDILYGELEKRIEKGVGVMEKGTPRVFFTLYPLNDPSLLRMIEDAGMILIPDQNVRSDAEGLSVNVKEGRDLWEDIGGVWIERGLLHCGMGAAKAIKELCKDFKVDGAILAYLFSCRTYPIWPMYCKELLEKEGIPVMTLEYDLYDTRDYSPERMRTRIETFAELVKARKAAKA